MGVPVYPLSEKREVRAAVWGFSPLLIHPLAMRWGSALPGRGVPLYPVAACRKGVLLCGGSPPLLHILATHRGSARPGQGDPLYPLTACGKRALLGWGLPPSPPLVDAHVKRTLPFGGVLAS